ncbi:MAG: ATP-binding protein [Planctomycetota bacterium]
MSTAARKSKLERTTFRTSRNLDFFSEKELVAQTGHRQDVWPLVILKELVDNALDACEEAGVAPEITVTMDDEGITVADNGPGMPVDTIEGVLDFSTRVSSREAYASPCRGAQGNALMTLVAMPYVLDGDEGKVIFQAHGRKHEITLKVDVIRKKAIPKKLLLDETETEYFRGERISNKRWKAQRVELNALAANPDRFIAWVEGKLEEHGLARKLIPPAKAIKEHAVQQREEELRQRVHDRFVDALSLDTMELGSLTECAAACLWAKC